MKLKELQKHKKGYYKGTIQEALQNYHKVFGVSDSNFRPLSLCFSSLKALN